MGLSCSSKKKKKGYWESSTHLGFDQKLIRNPESNQGFLSLFWEWILREGNSFSGSAPNNSKLHNQSQKSPKLINTTHPLNVVKNEKQTERKSFYSTLALHIFVYLILVQSIYKPKTLPSKLIPGTRQLGNYSLLFVRKVVLEFSYLGKPLYYLECGWHKRRRLMGNGLSLTSGSLLSCFLENACAFLLRQGPYECSSCYCFRIWDVQLV